MSKKPRILLVQNRLSYGGTSSIIMFIVKHFSDSFLFDLLCFDDNEEDIERAFLSYGGQIIKENRLHNHKGFFGKIKFYYMKMIGTISKIAIEAIKDIDYYAIHVFEELNSAYYLIAANKVGIKKRIVHFNIDHTSDNKNHFVARMFEKKEINSIANNATNIIGCSLNAVPLKLKSNSFRIINNPIDEKFCYESGHPNSLSLIQIGRIDDNKNQLFSLKILNIIRNFYNVDDVHLTLVGKEEKNNKKFLKKIKKYISFHKLKKSVDLLPPTSSINELYKQSTYVLFPSKSESFGMVLIEAQSVGLHCFSSNVVPKETNVGSITFLNLKLGPKFWAKTILDYHLKNKGERTKCDVQAFSIAMVQKEYKELYE